jgi:hypothetical protein
MADDLTKVPYTIRLSRAARSTVLQNISFALGLKLVTLLLVFPGWLTLWMAVLADTGGSLVVIGNGLRLLRFGGSKDGVVAGVQRPAEAAERLTTAGEPARAAVAAASLVETAGTPASDRAPTASGLPSRRKAHTYAESGVADSCSREGCACSLEGQVEFDGRTAAEINHRTEADRAAMVDQAASGE